MIANIFYSEICFDEPEILEQVKKLYKNPLSSPICAMRAVLCRCFLSATLNVTNILIINCHYLVDVESMLK